MTSPSTAAVPAPVTYLQRWRRVPRELGYLLPTLPIAVVSAMLIGTAFRFVFFGIASGSFLILPFLILLPLVLLAALYVARGLGWFERARLRAARQPEIPAPSWRGEQETRFWRRSADRIRDPHSWAYAAHAVALNPVIGGAASAFVWAILLGLLASPFVITWLLLGAPTPFGGEWLSFAPNAFDYRFDPELFSERIQDVIAWFQAYLPLWISLVLVIAIAALALLPFITHGLIRLQHAIASSVLGRWRSDELAQEAATAQAGRTAAVAAEDAGLRRLERDLHDGPQQRLVRLQMDLAAADRRVSEDPDAARALIAEAMEQSREALSELRALSRGFAPPILLDRGLVAALESLAIRAVLPVSVQSALPAGLTLSPEIERNAYFVASELVTNAAKHSAATGVTVHLALQDADGVELSPETAPLGLGAATLRVIVTDDGTGGAVDIPGHGLAGLRERLLGLGGILDVDSPEGGPTRISGRIPLPAAR